MTSPAIEWNLRQRMAEQGIFKTSALVPLLAEQGVALSREQVYRLVTQAPARLNIEVLAALCQILDCTPNDLITVLPAAANSQGATGTTGIAAPASSRPSHLAPVRARVSRPQQ